MIVSIILLQIMSHHLSLPKSASDMGSVDKYLQLQDSVPCKVRAKRGCATHPRSIAERVSSTMLSFESTKSDRYLKQIIMSFVR